jgi:hypothetical protein
MGHQPQLPLSLSNLGLLGCCLLTRSPRRTSDRWWTWCHGGQKSSCLGWGSVLTCTCGVVRQGPTRCHHIENLENGVGKDFWPLMIVEGNIQHHDVLSCLIPMWLSFGAQWPQFPAGQWLPRCSNITGNLLCLSGPCKFLFLLWTADFPKDTWYLRFRHQP